MKGKNEIHRLISRDCRKAMYPAAIFHTLNDCLVNLLSIYAATVLGSFADSILQMNVDLGVQNIVQLLICLVILVLLMPFVDLLGRLIMLKNSLKHDRKVLRRFLNKKYESIICYDAGDIQYRIEWDVCRLRIYWVELVTKIVMIPIICIYLLYQSLQISWIYTLVVIAISAVKLIVPFSVRKLESRYDKAEREYQTAVRASETEFTRNPVAVKLHGLTNPLIQKLDDIYRKYFASTYVHQTRCKTAASNITAGLDVFCMLAILFAGAVMAAAGLISAGEIAAMMGFFAVYQTVLGNLDFIIRNKPVYENLVERNRLLYCDPEEESGRQTGEISAVQAANLSFSYEEGSSVFENLAFTINAGEKVVIAGQNGSGKSTLTKLLCGLYTGYRGSLRVNGTELSELSMESLRKQVAYAAQDPFLFEGSVRENIRLGNLNASDTETDAVIDRLGIRALAGKNISAGQKELSGGEKQKISIARALLKNTSFLILDEPSNNLDQQTIEWLRNFIASYPKTILYISHEKQMIEIADKKIVLQAQRGL